VETQIDIKQGLSMIVVEDEEEALQLLCTVLATKYPDSTIHSAVNGRTGLELIKTHLPDIVITDISMPVMCGNKLAENICEIKADTKIIAITGNSCGKTPENINFDFQHVIGKPIIFQELFNAIDQCIAEFEQKRTIQT